MASTTSKLTMRLLIDTKTEKVIFAAASKPVVDFLLYILCLPIGSVVKLLGNNGMAGSIENVYQSVQDLNQSYMQSEDSKYLLLNPIASISSYEFCNLLPTKDEDDEEDKDYDKENKGDDEEEDSEVDDYYYEDGEKGDDYYYYYYDMANKDVESSDVYYYDEYANDNEDDDDGVYCYEEQVNDNEDGVYYDEEEGYGYEDGENGEDYDYEEHTNYNEDGDDGVYFDDVEGYGSEDSEDISINNGFVKENVTFLVMDDLVIQPFTFTSMIEIVNKFNIKKETREMIVELGMSEGIQLLKASLESKMVLTSVFVNKQY